MWQWHSGRSRAIFTYELNLLCVMVATRSCDTNPFIFRRCVDVCVRHSIAGEAESNAKCIKQSGGARVGKTKVTNE